MTFFFLLLAGLAVAGVAGTIVVVAKDGYRREPTRSASDPPRAASTRAVGPSDLVAAQWLGDRTETAGEAGRGSRHAAGVMVLRPW